TFFFQAEDGIRDFHVTGVQTCALPIFVIALDGENAWEYYDNDGKEFFHALYRALEEDPLLNTVTVSEYLAAHPPTVVLDNLWTGSWISDNLETWIGESEENTAWTLLAGAKAALAERSEEHTSELQSRENLVCRLL